MTGRFLLAVFSLLCCLTIATGCGVDAMNSSANDTQADQADQAPVEMELVVAEAGVGKKGQVLQGDDVNKKIAQPLIVLRKFEQDIVFMTAKKWLTEYEIIHGEVPQTLEEYREKIVKPNGHDLPELPEGHEYVWKPEEKTLYVRRPKTK